MENWGLAVKNGGDIVCPACMGLLTLRLFGGFEGRLPAGPRLTLPTKKAEALLAYLALRPGEPHPRDKVAALLWGDKPEQQARQSLRQAISTIRKSRTDRSCLVLEGDAITLAPAAVEVDAVLFEHLVSDGSPSSLEQAMALYRGDFLAGLDVKEEMFEEWLMTERERLRELALNASARLLSHQLKNNLDEAAIQTALRLLALDPLQEAAHQILMRLYFKSGRRGAALMQYQRCVEMLQRELGAEPEPETKRLYQDILQRASGTAPAEMPQYRLPRRRRRKLPRPPLELHAPGIPLVGREPELARLREAMREAGKGRGQTIIIMGETGIGKSRLVEELCAEAIRGGGLALLGRSYEIERVLPFGPWVNALRGGKVIDDSEIIQSLDPIWRAELARLFPELGVPGLELSTDPDNAVRLFESVVQLVGCLASKQPLLFVLEDLHWADEMSLRLFSFLTHRLEGSSVLLIGTAREEEVSETPLLSELLQELDRNLRAVSFTLSPLSRTDTGTLVRRLAHACVDESFFGELEQRVWASSQGNPFIVVETMRALRQSANLEVESGMPLPEQVRVVVARRLDRLSDRAKRLVAVAAVIGREFDFAVLERASNLGAADTAEGVEELVRRRVFHGVGESFDFTHDRLREVAYAQILPPRRKLLHGLVAKAVEEVYADNLEPHYAFLGVHYREGKVWEKTTVYLHKAGVAAVTRSAHREAVEHFNGALETLKHLPENRRTFEQAITIRLDLGRALITIKDYLAPEVEETYLRARDLCQQLGETPQLFPVLWGLSRVYNFRGELQASRNLGEQLLATAQRIQDPALLLEAHHTLWATLFSLGELAAAQAHTEEGLALYNPEQRGRHAFLYGAHDSGVCGLRHAAMTLWLLGYPDQALQKSQAALALAPKLHHPFSLAFALYYSAWVHQWRGEVQAALELAEAVLRIGTEQGNPRWMVQGTFLRGALLARQGWGKEGITQMHQAVTGQLTALAGRDRSYVAVLLAEAYGKERQIEEGLEVVTKELDRVHKTGERFYESELHRINGELLLGQAVPDEKGAESCFQDAIAVARRQQAKSLELRAAMSLSSLWQRQGKKKEARQLLADIYGWFTEAFDTADLKEAKELLEGLSWI